MKVTRASAAAPTPEVRKSHVRKGAPNRLKDPELQRQEGVAYVKAALDAELARLQLRLVDARIYLQQGLANSPLAVTDHEVEEQAVALLRACSASDNLEAEAQTGVASLMDKRGPEALPLLLEVLATRREGALAEMPEQQQKIFAERSQSLIDAAQRQVLEHLARTPGAPNHKRALQAMLAASTTLDGVQTLGSDYSKDRLGFYDGSFDCFTNEPGLAGVLESTPKRGGAAVGVAGALLDVAAASRAELVVSIDSNPAIKDFFLFTAGVLLLADGAARSGAGERAAFVREVFGYESSGFEPKPNDDLKARVMDGFRRLGFPSAYLERLPRLYEAVFGRGQSALWLRDDTNIEHLCRLAVSGRILATTSDIADPDLSARLSRLLTAHRLQVGAVHVSNAFDYITDIRAVVGAIEKMPRQGDARITSSSDYLALLDLLGSFGEPRDVPVAEWLGAEGIGEKMAAKCWQDPAWRKERWRKAAQNILGWRDYVGTRAQTLGLAPENAGEFAERTQALVDKVFSDPKTARKRMAIAFHELRLDRDLEAIYGANWQDQVELPVPHSLSELPRLAAEVVVKLWTPKRKRVVLKRMLSGIFARFGQRVSNTTWREVQPKLRHARFYGDLQALCREIDRDQTESYFRTRATP